MYRDGVAGISPDGEVLDFRHPKHITGDIGLLQKTLVPDSAYDLVLHMAIWFAGNRVLANYQDEYELEE